jgi:hypothetical protein
MSIASQNARQKFPFPYDDVFDGVVATIPDSGFRLKSQDRLIGRVTASAGTSFFSRGENVTIIVEKIDKGSTVVGIESALKVGMNAAGARNFDRLIESLSSYLWAKTQSPAPAEAVAKPVPRPQAHAPKGAAAELSIPCPVCGRQLRVSALKQGENWCPYCFEKFMAE